MSTASQSDLEAIYPLSPMQQGLLFHSLVAPRSGVYVLQFFCAVHGDIDMPLFARAWELAVARHPVLRTLFVLDHGDKPLQVVLKTLDLPLETLDWIGTPAAEQADRFRTFLEGDRRRGFDVTAPPLFRLFLIRMAPGVSQLVWTVHHAIIDGWSISLVFREVFAAYEAFRAGREPGLPAVRPYADYIDWLGRQQPGRAEQYWREQLRGIEAPTPLPPDEGAVPPGRDDERAQKLQFAIGPEDTAALREAARRYQVTLNTVIQGAWALLLARYAGEDDVVFGATMAGRPASLAGVESMVGLFINTLPVRVRVADDAPVGDWLRRLQASQAASREFEYSSLVDVQGWSEVPRGRALFDTLLLFESFPSLRGGARQDQALTVGEMSCFDATHYAITLSITPGEQLVVRLLYDSAAVGPQRIASMARHLRHLLAALAKAGDGRVGTLALLDEAERAEVVHGWNRTAADYPRDRCVHELFDAQASRASVAVRGPDGQLTYAELEQRSNQLAHHLIESGVGPGVLVAICLDRRTDLLVALLGVLKAGGAYVPLDPAYPPARLAFMLEDACPRVLVTERALMAQVPASDAAVLVVDDERALLERCSGESPGQRATPDDLAYVIYTSGSTGRPKGVAITHRALTNFLCSMQREPGFGERDTLLAVTTLSFDIAGLELFLPLISGGRIELVTRDTASSGPLLLEAMAEAAPTVMQATPATWRMLVEAGWRGTPSLTVLCGGEALPADLARQLTGRAARVWNVYGPTETTIWSTLQRVTADARGVPIGRPLANTQVYVVDPRIEPVPPGAPGELLIGGDGLARGYLNRPDLTAERFVPDPFSGVPGARLYRTGDLVRHRADGSLEYLSRLDHQVKLRGFRIELGEIEAVLAQHAAVRQAVAVIREDSPGDQRLVAYVVTDGAHELAPGALREHAAEKLPSHMVPSAFVALETMPLTPNGKVDRRALPVPEGRREVAQHFLAPRTAMEELVARIWAEVLRVDRVGLRDNFFELGGHSLLLMQAHARVVQALGREVPIVALFEHPTIEGLVRHLGGAAGDAAAAPAHPRPRGRREGTQGEAVAVVGMSARFPGADDIEAFWKNLAGGVESVRFFTDEELTASGVPRALLDDPNYVRARAVMDGVDLFDAAFFGYTPREAQLMDPQQRLFLECAWEALERAGYDPQGAAGLVGVYAGSSMNAYAFGLFSRPDVMSELGAVGALLNGDKDYLPSRVSYKLNLRGPSVNVQAACSTSLVAIHEACHALLDGECDLALAGGVSVTVPVNIGYTYQDGGIVSPDGHCRAFDARARGTIGGSGVGVVVLKRLSEAVADGDTIRAVIKGTALNNDGSSKVGFTAPSVEGQAEVIAMAHAAADVHPETIGYVEAHGTGTLLGDPIEVKALAQVFGAATARRGFCALGSVKTNIGHLDAAAGVAGFIKTVLALEHREIPPSLHFEQPNPQIDFEASAFRVNASLRPWEPLQDAPRRAGVSSFGLGGTNAHVVLEEAPPPAPAEPSRDRQLLVLSARTEQALVTSAERLAAHLERNPEAALADVAFTLQAGRHAFAHRRAVVCADAADAVRLLREGRGRNAAAGRAFDKTPSVAFLFPGQGSQHLGMGGDLYRDEPVFREAVDACAQAFIDHLGVDVRDVMRAGKDDAGAAALLARTSVTQAALFSVELALARLWMSWGIRPDVMIGHSIGEYVAASLSGALSLGDAAMLVALRGRLMDQAPAGRMLAVTRPAGEVEGLLGPGTWLAALNSRDQCVVSGESGAIAALEATLAAAGIESQALRTSGAFHSGLMAAVMQPLTEAARRVTPGRIGIPYVSNVTGDWARETDLDASYWARHVRSAVRFADGLDALLEVPPLVCLEVGPGQTLSGLVKRQLAGESRDVAVVSSLGHQAEGTHEGERLTRALGQIWLAGGRPDWHGYHQPHRRLRVELPTYPFDRRRHWIDARPAGAATGSRLTSARQSDVGRWFSVPSWARTAALPLRAASTSAAGRRYLVFEDGSGIGAAMSKRLEAQGATVIGVEPGERFARLGALRFAVEATSVSDLEALWSALREADLWPDVMVHAWNVDAARGVDAARPAPFFELFALGRALANVDPTRLEIVVLTTGVHEVTGGEPLEPIKATALGPCRVLPLEYPGLRCRHVDLVAGEWAAAGEDQIRRLCAELHAPSAEPAVAYRGGHRWALGYAATPLEPASPATAGFRDRGVYLITGGLGGVGLQIAAHLARTVSASVVLTSRRGLPARGAWDDYLAAHPGKDTSADAIRAVRAIEAAGGSVTVAAADVSDVARMREIVEDTARRFGRIDGVFHAAGIAGAGLMQLKSDEVAAAVLAPKVAGTLALSSALDAARPGFLVLCSSVTAVTGGVGQVDYCGANAFLDAFAHQMTGRGLPTCSIDWDTWQEVGMAVNTDVPAQLARQRDEALKLGIAPREGLDALERVLAAGPLPQVVVSTRDIGARMTALSAPLPAAPDEGTGRAPEVQTDQARPDLAEPYVAPRNDIETSVAEIWQRLFGIGQIGVHDNFFELGGHSLLATQLVSRLRAEFQVELRLDALFETPTVAGLSDQLLEALIMQDGVAADALLASVENLPDDGKSE